MPTIIKGAVTIKDAIIGSIQVIPTLGAFSVPSVQQGSGAVTLTPPTSTSTGSWSYTSSDPTVATVSGSTLVINSSGTAVITATQSPIGKYAAASTTAVLTVTSIAQSYTNTITAATGTVLENTNQNTIAGIARLDAQKYITAYSKSSTMYFVVGTSSISGTTSITDSFGTALSYPIGVTVYGFQIVALSATSAVCIYAGAATMYAMALTISGTTITRGTPITLFSAPGTPLTSLTAVNSSQAVVSSLNAAGTAYQFNLLNVSGTVVSTPGGITQPTSEVATGVSIAAIDGATVGIVYTKGTAIRANTISVGATTLSIGTPVALLSTVPKNYSLTWLPKGVGLLSGQNITTGAVGSLYAAVISPSMTVLSIGHSSGTNLFGNTAPGNSSTFAAALPNTYADRAVYAAAGFGANSTLVSMVMTINSDNTVAFGPLATLASGLDNQAVNQLGICCTDSDIVSVARSQASTGATAAYVASAIVY